MKESKGNVITLFNPNFIDFGESLRINKIEFSEQTRIEFYYKPPSRYDKGGWIQIDGETYITTDGGITKLKLIESVDIPIAPEKHYFTEANTTHIFWLIFPKISPKIKTLDIIERNEPGSYFNFFQLDLTRWGTSQKKLTEVSKFNLTMEELRQLHLKVLQFKIDTLNLNKRKDQSIKNQAYEKAAELREEGRNLTEQQRKIKEQLLDWYGSIERTPEHFKSLNIIQQILFEFHDSEEEFTENYIIELGAQRKRLINKLLRCHPQRDIEKLLAFHQQIKAIDDFIEQLHQTKRR
jgi:hypothetical protein